jgi:hybrid cluster-associated redox disulfide protein
MVKTKKEKTIKKIDPNMPIADLAEMYPEIVDVLVYDYGFHCVGCFVSEFETLIEGAEVHGIIGEDFDKLINEINEKINL